MDSKAFRAGTEGSKNGLLVLKVLAYGSENLPSALYSVMGFLRDLGKFSVSLLNRDNIMALPQGDVMRINILKTVRCSEVVVVI